MTDTYTAEDAIIQNQSDMMAADASMALTYSYSYDEAYAQLEQNLAAVLAYVDDMRASGDSIPPELLLQYQKMQIMQDQFLATQGQVNQNNYDLLLQYQEMFGDLTIEGIEAMMNRLDAEDTWSDILEENERFNEEREARKAKAEADAEKVKARKEAISAAIESVVSATATKKVTAKKKSPTVPGDFGQVVEDDLAASFFRNSHTSTELETKPKKKGLFSWNDSEDVSVTQHIGFRRPNPRAIANIKGNLEDGSPLHPDHFGIPHNDWEKIKQTLINGVITGENSDKIAQKIKGIHESMKQRAIGLARTEMFNAHRKASHETYQANDDVLNGWIWHAHLSSRTCAVCWAMHGKKFTTKQMMKAHVCCRCTQVPDVKGHDLGFVDGETMFAKLSERDQLTVLGPTKFAMYKKGTIKLSDLVGYTTHPRFGEHPHEKSLKQLQAEGFDVPDLHTQNKIQRATLTSSTMVANRNKNIPQIQYSLNPNIQVAFDEAEATHVDRLMENINSDLNRVKQFRKNIGERIMKDPRTAAWLADAKKDTGRTIDPTDFANQVAATWNGTSGDSDVDAIATQVAAQREFGIKDGIFTYDKTYVQMAESRGDWYIGLRQVALRAQYDETQQFFKDNNIQYVDISRGMSFHGYPTDPAWHQNWKDRDVPTQVMEVPLNPLSSFSTSTFQANKFAGTGYMFQARVKAEQVHSFFATGLGTNYEHEVVLLGGKGDMLVTTTDVWRRADALTDADGYPMSDTIHGTKKSNTVVAGPNFASVPSSSPGGYNFVPVSSASSSGNAVNLNAIIYGGKSSQSNTFPSSAFPQTPAQSAFSSPWKGKVSKQYASAMLDHFKNAPDNHQTNISKAKILAASGSPIPAALLAKVKTAKEKGYLDHNVYIGLTLGKYEYTGQNVIIPKGWVGDPLTGSMGQVAPSGTTVQQPKSTTPSSGAGSPDTISFNGKTVASKYAISPVWTTADTPEYAHIDIISGKAHQDLLKALPANDAKALEAAHKYAGQVGKINDITDPIWGIYVSNAQLYADKYHVTGLQQSDFQKVVGTPKTSNTISLTAGVNNIPQTYNFLTLNTPGGQILATQYKSPAGIGTQTTSEYVHIDIANGVAHNNIKAFADGNESTLLQFQYDNAQKMGTIGDPNDTIWAAYMITAQNIADKHHITGYQTSDFNPSVSKSGPKPVVTQTAVNSPAPLPPAIKTTSGGGVLPSKLDKTGTEALFKAGGQYDKKLLNSAIKDYNANPTQWNYNNYLQTVNKISKKLNTPATPIAMTPAVNPLNTPVQSLQDMQTAGPRATVGKSQVSLSEFTYDSPKPGGSADGAIYKDKNGDKWLVKAYPDSAQADVEVLAGKLYGLGGGYTPELMTIDTENQWPGKAKIGVASKWLPGSNLPIGQATDSQKKKAAEDFALDAWLANWDTIGASSENTVIAQDGTVYHVDVGGSLTYKAMGGKKGSAFGDTVGEWSSLRDPKYPNNYNIFGKMSNTEMVESAKKVLKISDDEIRNAVMIYGPGTVGDRKALADKLIARKQDIAKQAQAANGGVPVDVNAAPPTDWNAVLNATPVNRIPKVQTSSATVNTPKPMAPPVQQPSSTFIPKPTSTISTPQPAPAVKPTQQPLIVVKPLAGSTPLVVPKGTKVAPPKVGDTVDDIAVKKQMLDALLKQGDISKAWYYKSNKKLDEFIASGQALPSTINKTGNLKSGVVHPAVANIPGAPGTQATPSFSIPNPKGNSFKIMTDGPTISKNSDLQAASKAIDSAITIGDNQANFSTPVFVKVDKNLNAGGQFEISKNANGTDRYTISIDPNSATPHLDYVHKMAHYIEHEFINKNLNGKGVSAFGDLIGVIAHSPTYKNITSKLVSSDPRYNYYDYLSGVSETFARAFTQYIAIKSDDPALKSQLQLAQKGSTPKFWGDTEFAPIVTEFDKMFIDMGWAVPK